MKNLRRMSGIDALFFSMELPEQPMQIMVVAVLRPGENDGERSVRISLDDVRQHVACRLDALPAFRLCVKQVPFGLHHPVFVEASDFELDHHLSHAMLPAPGGPAELDRLYASLAERCLDRRRPLWHLTLVDGVESGLQALVLEVHHCLMDGAACLILFSNLFSSEAAQPNGIATSGRRVECAPGRWRLVVDALADQGRGIARLPALIRKTNRGMIANRKVSAVATMTVPRPRVDTPPCSLNLGFTPERRFARAKLPLADVQVVKNLAGVTANDVVLCIIAGALRDYLARRHDLPDVPLVANVPVGLKASGDPSRAVGNHITRLTTSLATNVADPWVRLQLISAVTRECKRRLDRMGRKVTSEWLDLVPPAIFSAVAQRNHRRRRSHPDYLDTNVTISSIHGPVRPWSFGSAVVEEMYLTAPPNTGVGVTFAVWDYAGSLLVGILSFADSVDKPGELASGLSRSLSELLTVARYRQEKSASPISGSAYNSFPVADDAPAIEGAAASHLAAVRMHVAEGDRS